MTIAFRWYRFSTVNCGARAADFHQRSPWSKTGSSGFSKVGLAPCVERRKLIRYRATKDGLHEKFIEHHRKECLALLLTSNEDLYPVGELLAAHNQIAELDQALFKKLSDTSLKNPSEWLPFFWSGLVNEGRRQNDDALKAYLRATELSGGLNWQPILRIGYLMSQTGHGAQARSLMTKVKELRPDLDIQF
jgi:hypothetical protein